MTRPSSTTYTETRDNLIYGNHPVVTRSVTIDASQTLTRGKVLARKNKKASIAVVATGGTFKLGIDGEATSDIAYNAAASVVQAALEALGYRDTDLKVSGGALATNPVVIEFRGRFAGIDIPVTADGTSLTGPGAAVTSTDASAGATGRYVAADGTSSGGVEDPIAILAEDVSTGAAGTEAAIVYEAGHFNGRALSHDFVDGMLKNVLAPLGIHIHDSQATDV